jgi:nucleoside-diphosphate-sugar epimerase
MNVLVTGGHGFIGAALCRKLEEASPGLRVWAPRRSEFDLSRPEEARALLAQAPFSKVVHLAASLARGPSAEQTAAQWKDTFEAGRNLLEAAAKAHVPHVIASGSVEELGNQPGALAPDAPSMPMTQYGLCKTLVRETAAFLARQRPMQIDWFRPFTVYGPGQRGLSFVSTAMEAGRRGSSAEFTEGSQLRDFIHVDDVVQWILLVMRKEPTMPSSFQIHHVGTGVGVALRDVLSVIASEFPDADFRIGSKPRRPGEPDIQIASLQSSAHSSIDGWAPAVSWRDGLVQTARWWKEQPV